MPICGKGQNKEDRVMKKANISYSTLVERWQTLKKKNKEEQNLLSQLEILELLVQDRESIIAAAQPGGTYMPGIQNNF